MNKITELLKDSHKHELRVEIEIAVSQANIMISTITNKYLTESLEEENFLLEMETIFNFIKGHKLLTKHSALIETEDGVKLVINEKSFMLDRFKN